MPVLSTIVAHFPRTASGRAAAVGHLDRVGSSGVGQMAETEDTISIIVSGYTGTKEEAERLFPNATEVTFSEGLGASKATIKAHKSALSAESPWPVPEGVPLVASQREFDPRTPAELAALQPEARASVPDQGGAPNDPATGLSPNMTGAGLGEARRDRQALGLDTDAAKAATAKETPASKAKK